MITDSKLIEFYKKYMDLKNKIDIFEKTLDNYKAEVLDEKKPSSKRIFLRESMFKLAFKDLVESHENFTSLQMYDPNFEDHIDVYI